MITLLALLLVASLSMAACKGGSSGASAGNSDAFADRELSDMSGYGGLDDYLKETVFVETTVAEMDQMMKDGETFAVFFSFEDCPYCNRLIPYLNDAALDAGIHVGYIDTRAKPEWTNNMDIDDYDIVVDRFGDYLAKDDDGTPHLYVPDVYFIKNGKVVARHDGVTPGADDPSQELTSSQEEQLRRDLRDEFAAMK